MTTQAIDNLSAKPARIDRDSPESLISRIPDAESANSNQHQIVASLLETFFLYCSVERQYSLETQAKIEESFRSWLLPHFGRHEVRAIKPVHLLSFRQAMAAKSLSVARQYSLLMTLKLFLKFCRTVVEINCLDPATIKLPRRKDPQVEYLTNAEIEALRQSIDTSGWAGVRHRALFEMLLGTGLRISEALSLDRGSIDAQTKEMIVCGKGGRSRTIFFPGEALRWLDKYLALRRDVNTALFVTYGESPKRLRRGDIPRFFKAIARRAGVDKRLTPHLLRHTFCTNLRNNGADISLIKDLAGHQDIQTTARYYLGTDKAVLRDAVTKYLNYDTVSDQSRFPAGR